MGSSGSKESQEGLFITRPPSSASMPTILEEGDGNIAEDIEEEELFYSYKVDSFSGVLSHSNRYNVTLAGAQLQKSKTKVTGTQVSNVNYVKTKRRLSIKEAEKFESTKKSLKILYASEEAWMIPLQWLPNTRLEPEEYFVDLELEEMNRSGVLTRKNKTTLEEILSPDPSTAVTPKRILVRGEAGFGKSTLCTKIAYDWAIEKRGNIASKFELTIMYRLRDLTEGTNLEEELIDFCRNNTSLTSETLALKSEKILLILDGYDEASDEQRLMVIDILGLNNGNTDSVFRASTILVTSRPSENLNFIRLFHRHVRITGMSETNRKSLVKKLMKYDDRKSCRVLESLSKFDSSFLQDLSPFVLYLICYLHEEREEDETLDTPFKLLEAVTNFLGKRCNEREQLGMNEEEMTETFHQLGRFFFESLKTTKMIYSKEEIVQAFQNQNRRRLVQKSGLLKMPATFKDDYTEYLEPIHKLFVDYLAAFYLNNHFKNKCANPTQKLCFISSVIRKFGARFRVKSPSAAEIFLIVDTWVSDIEFVVRFGHMEKDKLKCLSNGVFAFTSELRSLKIWESIGGSVGGGTVAMEFRKMEEDRGFQGTGDIIPYWIRGREFVATILEKMVHQDFASVTFWQDNFKRDETKSTSLEFEYWEDDSILWSSTLLFSTQFNPETTTNIEPKGSLVFRKLTLAMNLANLKRDYVWCKRFTAFTLRCSRDMPAVGEKVESGRFLHALIATLESCKYYKWCRFDITPKNFDRAFALDCLVKRARIKLNLLQGKPMNEIIRVARFLERKEAFCQKLNFDFYEDDGQLLFLVVKN